MANFGMISVLTGVSNIFHAASYAENIQYIACGEYMQSLFIGFVPHAWECVDRGSSGIWDAEFVPHAWECVAHWRTVISGSPVRPTCVGMCRTWTFRGKKEVSSSHMRGNESHINIKEEVAVEFIPRTWE